MDRALSRMSYLSANSIQAGYADIAGSHGRRCNFRGKVCARGWESDIITALSLSSCSRVWINRWAHLSSRIYPRMTKQLALYRFPAYGALSRVGREIDS